MTTCPSCGHIWRASPVDEIALVVREFGAPVRRRTIEQALNVSNIGVHLQRAVDKGLVRRVGRGMYEAVTP